VKDCNQQRKSETSGMCTPVAISLYYPMLPLYSPVLSYTSPALLLYFPCTSPVLREYGNLAFSLLLDYNIIEKIDLISIRKKFLNVKYNIDCC